MIFEYNWNLKNGYPHKGINKHSKKVFGTFVCGGGSTMGYKLAGYDHLGGVEIDVKMADIYKRNHTPNHLYNMDIREFNKMPNNELPPELLELDLLDGSPPCSSFSTAGEKDKAWGKKKNFREGQSKQTLDDLVYIYVNTIKKLQPKVALLENVKGLISGNAKPYANKIIRDFSDAGYRVQLFLLNGASMGLPQKRERVFFIGLRNDLDYLPKLELSFNIPTIKLGDIDMDYDSPDGNKNTTTYNIWKLRKTNDKHLADAYYRSSGKKGFFTHYLLNEKYVSNTLISGSPYIYHSVFKYASKGDLCKNR